MSTAKIDRVTPRFSGDRLDGFEERIMFGDLGQLLRDVEHDRAVPEELVHGIESLKYFRDHYFGKRHSMEGSDRARLAAYDAAWCLELIDLAQRERAGRHYRA